MLMSPGEIKREYDQAKYKNKQIGILADLNRCSKEEIKRILEIEESKSKLTNVEPVEEKKKLDDIQPAIQEKELTYSEIMTGLYERLDNLDEQIKRLEEEYDKVTNAIEILGKMEGVNGKAS